MANEVGKPGPVIVDCNTVPTPSVGDEGNADICDVVLPDAQPQSSKWFQYLASISGIGPGLQALGKAASSATVLLQEFSGSDHPAGKAKLFSPADLHKLQESMAKHLEPIDVRAEIKRLEDPDSKLPGGGRAAWIEHQVAHSPRGEVIMNNALDANFDATLKADAARVQNK